MTGKCKKGLTLIELIIVIAILGIVISLGFSFFSFGSTSFSRGQDQSSIQHSVRMASRYITDEIRTSKDVMILEDIPASFGEFNYIYVEGTKIIHRKSDGSIQEIFGSTEDGPIELFFESTGNDKIVEFSISKIINNNDFEVKSSVASLNLIDDDNIDKEASSDGMWRVIRYSDPIQDASAIVRLDTLLLDLHELNAFLYIDTDGETLILDVPTIRPNRIYLPTKGDIGADISWSTESEYLVTSGSSSVIGTIYRPLWDETDQDLTITATISKESVEKEKDFKLRIKKLEPLVFDSESMTLTVQSGISFTHQVLAVGGNPGYTFSSNNLPDGITLDSNGVISGTLLLPDEETSTMVLSIPIRLEDNHYNTMGVISPNVIEGTLIIDVTE